MQDAPAVTPLVQLAGVLTTLLSLRLPRRVA